jgi:hypothetical protein
MAVYNHSGDYAVKSGAASVGFQKKFHSYWKIHVTNFQSQIPYTLDQ